MKAWCYNKNYVSTISTTNNTSDKTTKDMSTALYHPTTWNESMKLVQYSVAQNIDETET